VPGWHIRSTFNQSMKGMISMIGPVKYSISNATGKFIIFRNYGKQTPKISIQHMSKNESDLFISWENEDGSGGDPANGSSIGAGQTLVFNILPEWLFLKVHLGHGRSSVKFQVSYE
jgi:hypothetical protein